MKTPETYQDRVAAKLEEEGAAVDLGPHVAEAAGNWLWLVDTPGLDYALCAGDHLGSMNAALTRHFSRVTVIRPDAGDLLKEMSAWPAASFDTVVLQGVLDWWHVAPEALFAESRRLLRPAGWVYIGSRNPLQRRARKPRLPGVGALGRAMQRAGFRDIRGYYADPSHAWPLHLVPRERAAALAYETSRQLQIGGSGLRRAVAWVGLHGILYGGIIVLGRR